MGAQVASVGIEKEQFRVQMIVDADFSFSVVVPLNGRDASEWSISEIAEAALAEAVKRLPTQVS